MEVYVIADAHELRFVYGDQMTPKSTKLYIPYESETIYLIKVPIDGTQ